MKFLQQLNEEYRLFNITDDGIEEIDIEALLSDEDPVDSEDFEDTDEFGDHEESDTDSEMDYDLDDDMGDNNYNTRNQNYNRTITPNMDDGLDDLDDEDSDEVSPGELGMDSDLTGLDFDEESDEDDTPDFSNVEDTEYVTDDTEDYNFGDNDTSDFSVENPNNYKNDDFNLDSFSDSDETENDDNSNAEDFFGDEEESPDTDEEFADDVEGDEEEEDPDFQGTIRTVRGANLVYKRQIEDGTYTELWIFTSPDDGMEEQSKIRRAILAGTDIPSNRETSEDGSQTAEQTNVGNVTFIKIIGLEN